MSISVPMYRKIDRCPEKNVISRIDHLNQILFHAIETATTLDSETVSCSYKEQLISELIRLQEVNKQRIRFIERRVKERIRNAKILEVDFSR